MANDLNLALILSFVDKATKPARRAMGNVRDAAREAKGAQAGLAGAARRSAGAQAGLAGASGRTLSLMGPIGAAAAGAGAAIYGAVNQAVNFEKAMAGVDKVLDMSGEGIDTLGDDILELSTQVPMAKEGLAGLVEAAAQAGVVDSALPDDEERAKLLEFARAAAQMGVAFDVGAGQAGEAMVTMRNRLQLSQGEVIQLGDAINRLGNNTAASSADILNVVSRIGSLAKVAGVGKEQQEALNTTARRNGAADIAALSAALTASARSPEIAATGLQNFVLALTAGEAATSAQRSAMQKLGFDAVELAERMQVDAKGAIFDVMGALSELDDAKKSSTLSQLFGRESIDANTPLLSNMEMLRKSYELVSDPAQFRGSMQSEYQRQANTTANTLQLTKNTVSAIATSLGDKLLPALNKALDVVLEILRKIFEWSGAVGDFIEKLENIEAPSWVSRVAEKRGAGRRLLQSWFGDDEDETRAPGRAMGGAVRPGQVYEWQERGREMFMPLVEGRVISAPAVEALKAAAASAAILGPLPAAAGEMPTDMDRLPPMSGASMAAIGSTVRVGGLDQVFDVRPPDESWSDVIPGFPAALEQRTQAGRSPGSGGSDGVESSPARALKAAAVGAAMLAPISAAAERAGSAIRIVGPEAPVASTVQEPAAATGRGDSRTVTIGDVHVHAAPGQDPAEVARQVRRELESLGLRARVPLHDGGAYDA